MIKKYLEKPGEPEQKESREPKILLHILYGPHGRAKDFAALKKALDKTDVYIPEAIGWTPQALEDFQSVARGEKTPKQMLVKHKLRFGGGAYQELKAIYNSQKLIVFSDISLDQFNDNNELREMENKTEKSWRKAHFCFQVGEFSRALAKMREYINSEGNFEIAREKIIIKNLKEKLKKYIPQEPRLKDKKEIKVLLRIGSAHTKIFHTLKKEMPLSREFVNRPTIFDSMAEALRRIMFSREVKDGLLAKIFIEAPLTKHLKKITDYTNKIERVARKLTSQLNLPKIERISKNLEQEPETNILQQLKKFNIKIPESEQEMDELLKLKKKV